MPDLTTVIKNTVSISQFNRGMAGKIFAEVKATGAKVVMKNNTAECVLISPDEYVRMMEEINDARLLALAKDRLAKADLSKTIPEKEVWKRFGIAAEDIEFGTEAEIE
ncbi:MAG: type II toxin-antitoxin system Phd/YefM family antitoxin [Lachnospiraceae bacterium]|nr:type II toxin-antitoxin system Phd/YefM family antitoxin [Lachnospiraceae bacterium]